MDSIYATVLELIWPNKDTKGNKPIIRAGFVKTSDWEAEPVLAKECELAYDVLKPLRNTELASVPESFEPLSSLDSLGRVCTMGKYICALLRSSLDATQVHQNDSIDAVLLMGGNIRGGTECPEGSFFSLEALEAEIKSDEVFAVVPMPGWLLAEGIQATHAGDPIPGWMQYNSGIKEGYSQHPPVVTKVDNQPFDMDKVYLVVTKISDLTNGQSQPWTEYYKANADLLPPKGAYINIQSKLMSLFARTLWGKLWDSLSPNINAGCDVEDLEARLKTLDRNNDGITSVEEIQDAMSQILGLSVDNRELTLAEFVHDLADTTRDGKVTLDDLQLLGGNA